MKILVAVASKHGSAWALARAIGETLVRQGLQVDVTRIEDVRDITKYDGFVLGSAVYSGHWLQQASAFMREHATELAGRPVWLFSSDSLGFPLRPNERRLVDIRPIAELVRIKEHHIFTNRFMHGKQRWANMATRLLHKAQGDCYGLPEVLIWVNSIAKSLTHRATTGQKLNMHKSFYA